MKVCPVEAKSLYADGQADGQTNKYDESNSGFRSSLNAANNPTKGKNIQH
jgi:hypothetical protein